MQDYVAEYLGQRFIEPQTSDLGAVYKDSAPTTPLVFVLSVGTDPANDLYKFAETMRFAKKLTAISLGQGQVGSACFLPTYLPASLYPCLPVCLLLGYLLDCLPVSLHKIMHVLYFDNGFEKNNLILLLLLGSPCRSHDEVCYGAR